MTIPVPPDIRRYLEALASGDPEPKPWREWARDARPWLTEVLGRRRALAVMFCATDEAPRLFDLLGIEQGHADLRLLLAHADEGVAWDWTPSECEAGTLLGAGDRQGARRLLEARMTQLRREVESETPEMSAAAQELHEVASDALVWIREGALELGLLHLDAIATSLDGALHDLLDPAIDSAALLLDALAEEGLREDAAAAADWALDFEWE